MHDGGFIIYTFHFPYLQQIPDAHWQTGSEDELKTLITHTQPPPVSRDMLAVVQE